MGAATQDVKGKVSDTKGTASDQLRPDISMFLKNIWFLLLFFALLLMIASFGLIAET
ncbi:MAG: hypothetical protein VKJ04_02800 [Vampirovibrionales bacterium]|nr:hypothetical protein [Vampirovibrionales bacterium]